MCWGHPSLRRRPAGLRREEVLLQRYRVLDGPETDASTVQQLWLAVHDSREITVELVCAHAIPYQRTPSGFGVCPAPSWPAVLSIRSAKDLEATSQHSDMPSSDAAADRNSEFLFAGSYGVCLLHLRALGLLQCLRRHNRHLVAHDHLCSALASVRSAAALPSGRGAVLDADQRDAGARERARAEPHLGAHGCHRAEGPPRLWLQLCSVNNTLQHMDVNCRSHVLLEDLGVCSLVLSNAECVMQLPGRVQAVQNVGRPH